MQIIIDHDQFWGIKGPPSPKLKDQETQPK